MTPRLTAQQRIEQSREAIAFLSNPAFGLDRSPLRARMIADHERRMASDARLVIPEMKGEGV